VERKEQYDPSLGETYHRHEVGHISSDGAPHFRSRRRLDQLGSVFCLRQQRISATLSDPGVFLGLSAAKSTEPRSKGMSLPSVRPS
jgi:hypothetical protein